MITIDLDSVLRELEQGVSVVFIARKLGVNPSTLYTKLRRHKQKQYQ